MSTEAEKMIARLQAKLKPIEAEAAKLKEGINLICELEGMPPMYVEVKSKPVAQTQLRGDEYHNMPQATAITEILERRKSINLAPVTIDEIYDDLISGGFQFTKGKNEAIQKRGLAISMSKNRKFYKLPNEKWGIKSWYNIKDDKKTTEENGGDDAIKDSNETMKDTESPPSEDKNKEDNQ
jgi:hypothetical protein